MGEDLDVPNNRLCPWWKGIYISLAFLPLLFLIYAVEKLK
jgi:hypothetical protein